MKERHTGGIGGERWRERREVGGPEGERGKGGGEGGGRGEARGIERSL